MVDGSLADLLERTSTNAAHWEALTRGELLFQRCRACAHAWLPPREECPACLAANWDWQAASGWGKVISWVVYHVAFHPVFEDRLPYTVAVVELDEGPRMLTNLVGPAPSGPVVVEGRVHLEVEQDSGLHLARFRVV